MARKPKLKDFESQFRTLKKFFAQLKSAHEDQSCSELSDEMSHLLFGSKIGADATSLAEFVNMAPFKQLKRNLQGFDLREVILLDNQSTINIFCNKNFVRNIRLAPEPLTLKSNGGKLLVYLIADVNDYAEPVWFSKKAIANIFVFKVMKKQYSDKAHSLYASLGCPSQHDFLWILLQSNQIKACPVTIDNAKVAYKIWGPSVAALKGKRSERNLNR